MLQVCLERLQFHSYHGVHAEEQLTGGAFEIDLIASYLPATTPVNKLEETIDYTILYQMIQERMMQPTPLLETLATTIAADVLQKFEVVEQVNISIRKLNAPIPNFQGIVGVKYEMKRNNR